MDFSQDSVPLDGKEQIPTASPVDHTRFFKSPIAYLLPVIYSWDPACVRYTWNQRLSEAIPVNKVAKGRNYVLFGLKMRF